MSTSSSDDHSISLDDIFEIPVTITYHNLAGGLGASWQGYAEEANLELLENKISVYYADGVKGSLVRNNQNNPNARFDIATQAGVTRQNLSLISADGYTVTFRQN
ncbi:hypothetical protein [Streptomyces sp. 900105245]